MSLESHEAPRITNVGGVAARGAAVTLTGQAARFVLQLIGIIVLSRILGPTAVGLYAALAVIVGLGEVLRDFGLSSAMIQASEVTRAQRSNLFWINAGLGVALAAMCAGIAPLVAGFYHEPELQAGCAAVGLVLVLGGLGTQFRAQLSRDLRFTAIAVIDVVGAAGGLVAGVVAATFGLGFWALVIQQIGMALVTATLNVAVARWLPGLPTRNANTLGLVRFGWNVGCTQVVNYLAKNVDTLVVGRFFGAESLGLYNRAYQLLTVPINQISTPATKVAFPVLSRIRGDQAQYDKLLLTGQKVLVHVVLAVFVYTMVVAPSLVQIALGEEWAGVADLYRILALAALVQTASYPTYWVFLSQGLTGESLRFTLVSKSFLVAAVLFGAIWGVEGVAAGYTIAMITTWPFGLWWLRRVYEEAPIKSMFWDVLRIFVIYFGAAAVAFVGITAIPGKGWADIGFGIVIYGSALLMAGIFVGPFRRDLREIAGLRKALAR